MSARRIANPHTVNTQILNDASPSIPFIVRLSVAVVDFILTLTTMSCVTELHFCADPITDPCLSLLVLTLGCAHVSWSGF